MRGAPIALLAALLLPGCAFLDAEASEAGGRAADGTATLLVRVHNEADGALRAQLFLDGEPATAPFDVAAGATAEHRLALAPAGAQTLRIDYALTAPGRSASGTQETTVDAASCAGTFQVTFRARVEGDVTGVGADGTCA